MALSDDARAQSPGTSPFQPSLTDPRNVQRFKAVDQSPLVTPRTILPLSGAGETGFDSTGAIGKKKKAKKKPGEPRPLPPPPPPLPGAPQAAAGQGSAQQIKARASYADAYKPPDAPVRRPLPPLQDAYEPLGIRAGTFLLKPAVEVTRGIDSNPSHVPNGKSSAYTVVEPSLKMQSNWERHEFRAELRGSYSNYDSNPFLDAPLADAKAFTRIDVTRDTKINMENRFYLSTDYPGSPNLPADITKLPVYTSYGTTLGLTQSINHLELSAKAGIDHTQYENSKLTDGETSSNQDRDFTQYSGAARASYEIYPGVKPFAELGADTRKHELQFDRSGFQRDSTAFTPRVGSTFEITRKLTGEVSFGYLRRHYQDPNLQDLQGLVFDASLKWEATGLTTATLIGSSRADESVVAGWSGALRRDVGVQVDHALRRWLIWTVKAGMGFDNYIGSDRNDTRMSIGSAITYKLNREVSLKGEYRYDQMHSTAVGVDYNANVFLVGLKLQR